MEQRRLIALLLRPSLISGAACVTAAAIILAVHTWKNLNQADNVPADSGPGVLVAAIADTISSFSLSVSIALSQPWAYYGLLAIASVVVGLLVFTALQATTGLTATVSETIDEAHTSGKAHYALGDTFGGRLVLRVIVAAAATLIAYATIVAAMPYLLEAWIAGTADLGSWVGWLQSAAATAGICGILHVHIILVRLLFLRPRVFGGTYQIMDTF